MNYAPLEYFKEMRARAPIHYNDTQDLFEVFTYNLACEALEHPHLSAGVEGVPAAINRLDGNLHTKLRREYMKPLRGPNLKRITEGIDRIACEIVQEIVPHETTDILRLTRDRFTFAVMEVVLGARLDAATISELVRIEHDALRLVEQSVFKEAPDPRFIPAMTRVHEIVAELTATQGGSWPADSLGRILLDYAASPEGDWMKPEDLLGNMVISLYGMYVTANPLLCALIEACGEYHDLYDRIRADRSLLGNFVREVFRLTSSGISMSRTATCDLEIGGMRIPKGARVIIYLLSANRDERVFPDPDRIHWDANTARHIAFGHGAHECAGSHIGLYEARALLNAIMDRFGRVVINPGHPICVPSRFIMYVSSMHGMFLP